MTGRVGDGESDRRVRDRESDRESGRQGEWETGRVGDRESDRESGRQGE